MSMDDCWKDRLRTYGRFHSLCSSGRLEDASRLLEIFLSIAERFKEASKRNCLGEAVFINGRWYQQSHQMGASSDGESELLYKKARLTAVELQSWRLTDVFPANEPSQPSRRLELRPPPAVINSRKRNSFQETLGRHENNNDNTPGQPSTQLIVIKDPPVHQSEPQVIAQLNELNNLQNTKDLHLGVKLSNLSILIETLESIKDSQWTDYAYKSLDQITEVSPWPCSTQPDPSLSNDFQMLALSTSLPPKTHIIPQCAKHTHVNTSIVPGRSYSLPPPSTSSDLLSQTNLLRRNSSSAVLFEMIDGISSSSHDHINSDASTSLHPITISTTRSSSHFPSIEHWESLLAALLLCIQLWKSIVSLQPPRRAREPYQIQFSELSKNCINFFSRTDTCLRAADTDHIVNQWISDLDKLTWKLELLSQRVIRLILSPISPHEVVHPMSGFNHHIYNPANNNVTCGPGEVLSDISVASAKKVPNSMETSANITFDPTSAVYMLSTISPFSAFTQQQPKKSSDGTLSPTDRDLKLDKDEGRLTNIKTLKNDIPNDEIQDNRLTTGMNGILKSPDGDRTLSVKLPNSNTNTPEENGNELLVNWESQMYLSRVAMPRLVPIWDDTLEAEVEKARFEEITAVQRALMDIRELQGDITIKIYEEGEALEEAQSALENTDVQTRQAAAELAQANKARSAWWSIKASGVGTVSAAVLGGVAMGSVGVLAGGPIGGAAGLFAGNSLRRHHDAKMDKILNEMNTRKRYDRPHTSHAVSSSSNLLSNTYHSNHYYRSNKMFVPANRMPFL